MHQVEAIRLALAELGGEASADELAAFVRERHGVAVSPKFVPVIKAMLREREMVAAFHRKLATERNDTTAAK